jgi:predicted nucleotidyltransferase component of viral defense system
VQRLSFPVQFRGANLETEIVSYNINEMLATKMRALFQRKKGRDLFDLYWALSVRSALPVSVPEMLQAFDHYMRAEGERVPRVKFIAHLRQCLADRAGFCTDLDSLLRRNVIYDPDVAGAVIERDVLALLPE